MIIIYLAQLLRDNINIYADKDSAVIDMGKFDAKLSFIIVVQIKCVQTKPFLDIRHTAGILSSKHSNLLEKCATIVFRSI